MSEICEFNVQSEDLQGITLIEASAGTGKTFTLALLVLRLAVEGENPPTIQQIAAVTFTKAATAELRERVGRFLRDALALTEQTKTPEQVDNPPLCSYISHISSQMDPELLRKRIEAALLTVDEASIFTIHGFCQRLLTDFAFESGSEFGREMISDQSELIEEILRNFWRKEILTLSPQEYDAVVKVIKSPSELHRRTAPALSSPLIEVEGMVFDKPQTAELLRKESALLAQIHHFWPEYSEEVCWEIENAKARRILNGNSYGDWILDLNTLFRSRFEEQIERDHLKLLCAGSFKTNGGQSEPDHPFFHRLAEIFSYLEPVWNQLKSIGTVLASWVETRYILYFSEQLTAFKDARNLGSFDDMISGVCRAVGRENPRRELFLSLVRNRYRAVLVDEFQDTDRQQFTIFKEIFSSSVFFMIGDPKQAIYRFRGGDVYAYLDAKKEPALREFTLSKNYRSQSALICALNALFSSADRRRPFLTEGIEYREAKCGTSSAPVSRDGESQKPLVVWNYRHPVSYQGREGSVSKNRAVSAINRAVTAEISQLIRNNWEIGSEGSRRRVTAGDIAVLVGTGREAGEMKAILNKYGIPAVTVRSGALYDSEEALQLLHILEAVISPGSDTLLRSLFFQRPFSMQVSDINRDMTRIMTRFSEYRTLWENEGVYILLTTLFSRESLYSKLISSDTEGYRPLTNYRHLFEQLHHIESLQGTAPLRLTAHLREMIADPYREEHLQRMENDESAVKIVTIHSSKGLEYPIVFVPYPWMLSYHCTTASRNRKEVHPVCRVGDKSVCSLDPHADLSSAAREFDEEQQRLFYVALTRASQRLYVVNAKFYTKFTSRERVLEVLNPAHRFLKPTHQEIERVPFGSVGEPTAVEPPIPSSCRAVLTFDKTVPSGSVTKSYSSLVLHPEPTVRPRTESVPGSLFAFPKGARTGNAWHRIFEVIDYSQPVDKQINLVNSALKEFGFTTEQYDLSCIYAMTEAVLSARLCAHEGAAFSLSMVEKHRRITEMPFHLRAVNGDPSAVRSIIERYENITITMRPENFHGCLQGFIDLIFEAEGKYYVLDWKSNHLGNTYECYSNDELTKAMEENEYRLQYILYLTAISLYLKSVLESFDYDRDIGGAYYVFLRGVQPQSISGFWFSKPRKETISELAELFTGTAL